MARFFIDTASGRVATLRQLVVAGVSAGGEDPPRPWFAVRGTDDATTLWYGVFRRRTRGVWLGMLAIRHSDHQTLLEDQGWAEVPVEEIRGFGPDGSDEDDRHVF